MNACLSSPAEAAAHLEPGVWARVNRLLVRKAIAEFSHELLLVPQSLGPAARRGWQRWSLDAGPDASYRFEAQAMALRHWRIDLASIERRVRGEVREPDALDFVIDFKERLGLRAELLPVYLDELSSTLYGAAFKQRADKPTSAMLAEAMDFQTFEHAMSEGHPGFVANNGRLGFDAEDYRAYAPEAGRGLRLVWLAVRREHAHFASLSTLSYDALMDEELGRPLRRRFAADLQRLGLDEADYLFMPAHPWQWFEKLSIAFAAHVAQRDIVCLGHGEDLYQPQQSIRTYFNLDRPTRHYVKTSLAILNMGFMRGLSPRYMAGTPAINEWIHGLVEGDAVLREHGFSILREVASIGFRHRHYEAAITTDSPYKKMLSCLWRESPLPRLQRGERPMTMAALLHVDRDGRALLSALVRRSGLDAQAWLRRYLRAYLAPLLHCFYAHDLVFMPHGENLILVMADHVPVRVLMKDIAEESAILDKQAQLPAGIERLAVEVPHEFKLLAIFIDVFDGFFRFLSQTLVDAELCEEDDFWRLVAECVIDYQRAQPQYRRKFEAHDLFADDFLHSCLNRLQLADNRQMVNLADPASSLKMAGRLPNPIARFRPPRREAATARGAASPA
ncbi:MAG TPA: IucA/IucC family siderophore biosynthesis protein [Methylibium sp.]|uniref:IucA/IucC family protein n=1 Tax=Methylibium sp. TaxID=2067992 RepID=UPI002DB92A6E|nr:IucA/IucC family siderophore biosynthesis protein [Methylibium sp.]HEU4460557.1 IucA/IucC family siderophore biosynthesis protein [Methylibium sp.]